MLHSVPLERLPETVRFPAELSAKISFDAEQRRLQYDGFMSKTDFDKLVRLSNELAYQRALESLFQVSTFRPAKPRASPVARSFPMLYTGIAALVAVTALALTFWH